MPKLKTKSSVKKRFQLTGLGKLRITQARKNHLMRHKPKDKIRKAKGTTIFSGKCADNVKKYFLPYR